jgi:hypothetical protein
MLYQALDAMTTYKLWLYSDNHFSLTGNTSGTGRNDSSDIEAEKLELTVEHRLSTTRLP